MQVHLIESPAFQAYERFKEYRAALRERFSKEDEMLMRAYRALSKDQKIVDVAESVKLAGLDEQLRPRIAIAPADALMCWFRVSWGVKSGRRFIFDEGVNDHRFGPRTFIVPNDSLGELPAKYNTLPWRSCKAVVPAVPPRFRPAGSLAPYHILWEAKWENVPSDPLLLRRIGNSHLFAVIAQWDLSAVEQAVLRGRYS